jgi:hypothetical protein
MSISIDLSPEEEERLRQKASSRGQTTSEYARGVLVGSLKPSLDEILAPFRAQVEESGVSDEELDRLFTNARDEVARERQRNRGS